MKPKIDEEIISVFKDCCFLESKGNTCTDPTNTISMRLIATKNSIGNCCRKNQASKIRNAKHTAIRRKTIVACRNTRLNVEKKVLTTYPSFPSSTLKQYE
ncbi:MAG: hypothetical protein PHR69_05725 [Sphaerochaeta sp.]|nr:hypothetical protein [Sphaerochaeta sp.]